MAAFATSGKIQRPLVTVAGTMDALLPIDHHARAYARKVAAAAKQKLDDDDDDDRDRHHGWTSAARVPAVRSPERQPPRDQ